MAPSDEAFVRFDPVSVDRSIARLGLQRRFFRDGKIWLTRYGFVKNIARAVDLETILYRRSLWAAVRGKFAGGATLRQVKRASDARAAGVSNTVNGVPQWRLLRDVPPGDLVILHRLP